MKKIFLLFLGLMCIDANLFAQSLPEIKPLSIGDTVPDVFLHNIINYKTASARISDFRGKLVILDFFATWCTNCIAVLPELDSLQREFGDKIQIFVVDYEPAKQAISFLKSNPIGKESSLPFITEDTLLSKLFPHSIVPHEVWIKPDGIFYAATAGDQVNKNNIKDLLAGKEVALRMKTDIMNFSMQRLLFFNKNVRISENNLKSYSILSGYIEGIPSGSIIQRDTNHLIRRVCFTNASIKQLYQFAFNISWPDNRYVINVSNPSMVEFSNGDYSAWVPQHTYCYELLTPPMTLEKIQEKMINDLVNYFGYKAEIEKRKIKCFVIRSDKNAKRAISPRGKPQYNFSNNQEPKSMTNQPISKLIYYLNYSLSVPVIDEANFTQPIDMKLPDDLLNIDSLKSALHQYGFDMKEANRDIEVFVISDK